MSRQVCLLINTSFQCDLGENELCCKISVCFKLLPRNETIWGRHGLSGWGHTQAAALYVVTEVMESKRRVRTKEGPQVIKKSCISWLMTQAAKGPGWERSLKAAAQKKKKKKKKSWISWLKTKAAKEQGEKKNKKNPTKKKKKKKKKNCTQDHPSKSYSCIWAPASFGQYTAMMQDLTCANVTHGGSSDHLQTEAAREERDLTLDGTFTHCC